MAQALASSASGGSKWAASAVLLRSILWIVVSSFFLVRAARVLLAFHAVGRTAGWWPWLQLLLWTGAFLFWLRVGWRDWSHRDETPKPKVL